MDSIGTTYGLALTSGINAYLPLLSFAIAVRLRMLEVNPHFAFVTQDGFMIALIMLTILDIIADKIPVVDSVWDGIHTVLRPISGLIVAGASSTHVSGINLPATLIIGGALASMSHTTKAVTRLTASFSTFGCLNLTLSVIEDIVVIVAVLLALFAPVLMLILSGLFVLLFIVFAPLLFSALSYRLRIAFSTLSWFVHSYFWRRSEVGPLDFMLNLSDSDRGYLRQLLPAGVTMVGGVRVLWVRRLGFHG